MVKRYPDRLTINYRLAGSFSENTGDFIQGTSVSHTINGRAEPNGSGLMITLVNGLKYVYNYLFIAKKQTFISPMNADAYLNSGEWEGEVKRHVNDQTGTRIWL